MTDTNNLIDQLAARAMPVKQLASPLRRTLLWVALATGIVLAFVLKHGARPGWLHTLADPDTAIEWFSSVLTGMLAAYALFQISVPGRSRSWIWLPLPFAILWLAGIGMGCMHDFAQMGRPAFAYNGASSECAWMIMMASVPLGLVLLLMVRHAGVVCPARAAMLAALSTAAFASAGVSLFHHGETALMSLLWHVGAVVLLSGLSWLSGRQLFSWIGYARRPA
jgi:hypothetical protein